MQKETESEEAKDFVFIIFINGSISIGGGGSSGPPLATPIVPKFDDWNVSVTFQSSNLW